MKLKELTEAEIYMIGFSVAKCDEFGMFDNLINRIGDKLKIDAVAGEGYSTTVWRACGAALDMTAPEEIPYIGDRICEALNNIGIEDMTVFDYVQAENYDAAIERLRQTDTVAFSGNDVADTIKIILDQQNKKVEYA